MKVEVKNSWVVKPATDMPQHTLWLSDLDIIIFRTHASVYFYRPPGSAGEGGGEAQDFFSTEKLKAALAQALVVFYPMAGRLQLNGDGRMELNCNNEGVFFLEAVSDGTINDLGDFSPSLDLTKLMPALDYGSGDLSQHPIALYQVTRFKCGGVSLGVRNQHAVIDGRASLLFMSSWANAACGLPITAKPELDRTVIKARAEGAQVKFDHLEFQPPPSLKSQFVPPENGNPAPTLVSKLYRLTPTQLKELKLKAQTPGVTFSSFETIAGHIWQCICKAREIRPDQESRMYINTDGRNRFIPPLPEGFFGNSIFPASPSATVGDLVNGSLAYAAGQVHRTLVRMDEEYMKSALAYLSSLPDLTTLQRGSRFFQSPNVCVTSWNRLPLYDADFGWGKPIFMGPAHPYEGRAYIWQSPEDERTLVVAITLFQDQLARFDELFCNF